jgi:hypothetical protein
LSSSPSQPLSTSSALLSAVRGAMRVLERVDMTLRGPADQSLCCEVVESERRT